MSSDDNHGQAHMTPTARNICTSALFFTSSFNFGRQSFTLLLQDSIKEGFLGKSTAELFDYVVSMVIHMLCGMHGVDTIFMFC